MLALMVVLEWISDAPIGSPLVLTCNNDDRNRSSVVVTNERSWWQVISAFIIALGRPTKLSPLEINMYLKVQVYMARAHARANGALAHRALNELRDIAMGRADDDNRMFLGPFDEIGENWNNINEYDSEEEVPWHYDIN